MITASCYPQMPLLELRKLSLWLPRSTGIDLGAGGWWVQSCARRTQGGSSRAGKSGARKGAAEVVLRIAVVARKLRTAELQNGAHLSGVCAVGEQFPRHPEIHNAPVGLRKTLGDLPSPHAVMVDLDGLAWGNRGWSRHVLEAQRIAAVDRRRGTRHPQQRPGGRVKQTVGIGGKTG